MSAFRNRRELESVLASEIGVAGVELQLMGGEGRYDMTWLRVEKIEESSKWVWWYGENGGSRLGMEMLDADPSVSGLNGCVVVGCRWRWRQRWRWNGDGSERRLWWLEK